MIGRTSTRPISASGTRAAMADGALHALALDQIEPRQLLLDFGERTIGDDRLPVVHRDPLRQRGIGQRLGDDQLAGGCELLVQRRVGLQALGVLLFGQRLPELARPGLW